MQFVEEVTPERLTKQIEKFREYLMNVWFFVDKATEKHNWEDDGSFIDDWVQSNWELLVERELLGVDNHLSPLSVLLKERPTENFYAVVTKMTSQVSDIETGETLPIDVPLRFTGFLKPLKSWATELYAPFEMVSLYNEKTKNSYLIKNKDLEFYLLEWDSYVPSFSFRKKIFRFPFGRFSR
ncbi:MAG: hypothetical protein WD595_05655 [Waddliaceae bacterium]